LKPMIAKKHLVRLSSFLLLLTLSAFFWVGIVPPQPRAMFEPFSDSDFVAFTPDSEILVTRQPRWVWPTSTRPWEQPAPTSLIGGGEERPGRVQVWSVQDGTLLQTLDGEWAKTDCVIPAPDSKSLIGWVGGRPESLDLPAAPNLLMTCDLRSGKVSERMTQPYPYEFGIDSQLILSPDGQWLAIAAARDRRGPFYLWRIGSDHLMNFDDIYSQVTFSEDGERLAASWCLTGTYQEDGEFNVVVWQLNDLTRPWRKQRWPAADGLVLPGCKTTATHHFHVHLPEGTKQDQLKVWDLETGRLLAAFPLGDEPPEDARPALDIPAGCRILQSSLGGCSLWDLGGHPNFVALAWDSDSISPDGQWLLRSQDPGVDLANLGSGNSFSLSHPTDTATNEGPIGKFSPDSRLVIVAEIGQRDVGPVGFWQSLRSIFIRAPAQDWVWMARLWNVETGKQVAAFEGCTKALFSPDGQTLATLHDDGSVRLWDTSFPPPSWRIVGTAVGVWVLLFVIARAWRTGQVKDEAAPAQPSAQAIS
jgi:WD40 repeat protein